MQIQEFGSGETFVVVDKDQMSEGNNSGRSLYATSKQRMAIPWSTAKGREEVHYPAICDRNQILFLPPEVNTSSKSAGQNRINTCRAV